jgi:hypothetical protein
VYSHLHYTVCQKQLSGFSFLSFPSNKGWADLLQEFSQA